MKRYKLLKELPTFKAGDEFYIDSNNDLRLKGRYIIAYNHYTLEKFPNILTDWFEEIPESSIRSRVAYSCLYYYVNNYGIVSCSYDYRDEGDDYLYGIGNYFKTEEEAKTYRRYLIARQALLDDAKGGKWKKNGINLCMYYNHNTNRWVFDDTENDMHTIGVIYFQDRRDAQKSLDDHKEQWEIVRKYEMGEK